ncbi:MAG: hypothetical protein JWO65_1967 [Sphingomonas bacterium]|jgi:predicted transcriptional regulator YheO|nr:hypothetical protein [Sphingomonas bacterium]
MKDLESYFAVADGLAALFSPFVEAVVHDVRSDTVAHVANAFSPREPGDPSDLRETPMTPDARVIGPYEKINYDGRRIRAISIVLRDGAGAAIGMLCINSDVTEFEGVRRMLQSFLGIGDVPAVRETAINEDWHERINRFVAAWIAERATTIDRLDRDGRRELIAAIDAVNGFAGKRSAAYVARMLGVSRATIYNELAKIRIQVAA